MGIDTFGMHIQWHHQDHSWLSMLMQQAVHHGAPGVWTHGTGAPTLIIIKATNSMLSTRNPTACRHCTTSTPNTVSSPISHRKNTPSKCTTNLSRHLSDYQRQQSNHNFANNCERPKNDCSNPPYFTTEGGGDAHIRGLWAN